MLDAVLAEVRRALGDEGEGRRPSSTYRLQLTAEFGFDDAAAVVPYLDELGITDVYLSPILQAAKGSTHGYDVVDHARLAPALGGEEAYARLCDALAARGMGQLVDFVPNHMGVGPENPWWMELLENGPSSRYAPFFDVTWQPLKVELAHKVLVPILGGQYGDVLERGELRLVREDGAFFLHYFDHRFPIAPRSVPQVLRHRLEELRARHAAEDDAVWELESICTSLDKLAPRHETDPAKVAERAREKEVAKRRLRLLCAASAAIREHVDGNVAIFNGRPGDPRSFDLLDRLLDSQAYRLAQWRVAGEEINYRRFFDVNGLAAIRMEERRVFEEAHRLVLRLVREGRIHGLRIDHPDGLYDPTTYFRELQAAAVAGRFTDRVEPSQRGAVEAWIAEEMGAGRLPQRPMYVVAEKILSPGERMPESWAIDGTTGYEFLAAASGLFVDVEAEGAFSALYARYAGVREPYAEIAYRKKKLVMSSSMASEMNMLAFRLNRISETNRRTRDFTLNDLTRALVEFVALFPVYRTYVSPRGEVDERDRAYVERTLARARRRSPVLDPSIFDFLRDVLLLRCPETLPPPEQREWLEFTLKLQQVTGPVTAKALEDTAFYAYVRLASLNEVGGEPRDFGTSPAAFHRLNAERRATWPGSLSATSTHDTKRSEDVRTRIAALSEVPREWRGLLAAWGRQARPHRTEREGQALPDRNDEYLFYQTVIGTFPEAARPGTPEWDDWVGRVQRYMEKAIKEAKLHTSWTNPDAEYEGAMRRFVEGALRAPALVEAIAPLARRAAAAGRLSSLAQVALKLASPGVADVYQGCELWDLSLVDPDNRRRVDFGARRAALAELARRVAEGPGAKARLAREVSAPQALADGRAKLLLLREGLHARRADPALFLRGAYDPLTAEGPHAAHVVAFARRHEGRALLCAVPRRVLHLLDGAAERGDARIAWHGRLPLPSGLPREWIDLVTGEPRRGDAIELAEAFGAFPVALLLAGSA
jgi:(1->4)-alpha-D-glucan 1-alpha-D-glucosylmutase